MAAWRMRTTRWHSRRFTERGTSPPPSVNSSGLSSSIRNTPPRSDERLVGKECRSRWSPYHSKKKKETLLQRDSHDTPRTHSTPLTTPPPPLPRASPRPLRPRACTRRPGTPPPSLFSSRRRHTRLQGDWSSDVCSSD